jgi:Ni/Co efflux regulator RcnB
MERGRENRATIMKRVLVFAAIACILLPSLSIAQNNDRSDRSNAGRSNAGSPQRSGNRPSQPGGNKPGNPGRPSNPGRPGGGHGTPSRPGTPGHPGGGRPGQPSRPSQPNRPPRPTPPHAGNPGRPAPHPGRPSYRPPHFARPLPPRGNQFWHRGSYYNRIPGPAFIYPRGWGYRAWTIGAVFPALFLTPAYFYNGYQALGLEVPPPGYAWVRYGPDLVLVDLYNHQVEDVVYGVFQ